MLLSRNWLVRGKVAVAVVGLFVVAAASGLVGASFAPNLTGAGHQQTIYGCVNNYTGSLRIAYGDGRCSASERPLNWDAGNGAADIQVVTGYETIDNADLTNRASVSVECPAGYQVIGGGAGLGTAVGSEIWTMTNSTPVEAGSGVFENDGWIGLFETVDGQDSDGQYSFFADAICLENSQ